MPSLRFTAGGVLLLHPSGAPMITDAGCCCGGGADCCTGPAPTQLSLTLSGLTSNPLISGLDCECELLETTYLLDPFVVNNCRYLYYEEFEDPDPLCPGRPDLESRIKYISIEVAVSFGNSRQVLFNAARWDSTPATPRSVMTFGYTDTLAGSYEQPCAGRFAHSKSNVDASANAAGCVDDGPGVNVTVAELF